MNSNSPGAGQESRFIVDSVELPDEKASEWVATKLAACLQAPLILTFSGEIGAGKTTFIRAMLRALGIQSAIKSPTFSLVETYEYKNIQIHHFDLYRIHDETDLEYIGFRDYFLERAICCIEWPERAIHYLKQIDINFAFSLKESGRLLKITTKTATGAFIRSCLRGFE